MNCLCFDTSGEKGCVSVIKNNELSGSIELSKIYGHNETLLPSTKLLFDKLSLKAKDLDCVAFVRGPGSFTGLRIGIATAYGIKAANPEIELKGYTSLYLHARKHILNGDNVLVLLDARKKQVYAALFINGKPEISYRNVYPDEIAGYVSGFNIDNLVITGNGYLKYKEIFDAQLNVPFEFKEGEKCLAKPLAEEILTPLNIEEPSIEPLYIRKSDAEVNRDKKRK